MKDARSQSHLDHMIQATKQALDYVDNMDRSTFMTDTRTQQAVIMNLLIIGEAASRILQHAPNLIEITPKIPWSSMRGMRNRIAHGYFSIDLDVVWATTQTALPELLDGLEQIAKDGNE